MSQKRHRLKLQNFFDSLTRRLENYLSHPPPLSAQDTPLEEQKSEEDMSIDEECSIEDASLEKEHVAALINTLSSGDTGDRVVVATKQLLDWAVSLFGSVKDGSSARDILDAVHHPAPVRDRHTAALERLTNTKLLQHLLHANPTNDLEPEDSSYQIVSLIPRPPADRHSSDSFQVEFKSKPIGDHAIQRLKTFQYEELLQLVSFCRAVPGGPSLAGVIFEQLANRMLAGDRDARRRTLRTYGMTASNQMPDKPSFTMSPTPSRSKFLDSKHARHIEPVNFNDPSAYTEFSMGDIYFVPTLSSNPLLDSFCVDYSNGSKTSDVEVDVWLFQVTLSPGPSWRIRCRV